MSVPILQQGPVLVVVLHDALGDRDLLCLRDALAERIGRVSALGVVIDVTALDVLDSFACRMLRGIAQMSWLRGAETVVVGIQPGVAFAMTQLGLSMEGVATELDLEDGLARIAAKMEARGQS